MHIWGSFALHPMTYPIADQVGSLLGMSCQYALAVCGATLKPTVEDFMFLFNHIN